MSAASPVVQWSSISDSGSEDPGSNPGRAISNFYILFYSWYIMAEKEKSKGKEIGVVSNYFKHVKAAAIKLSGPLKKGDKIKIVGGEKEVEVGVDSMEIDRKPIEAAKKGDEIGLLVPEDVHKGNKVYKI